MQVNGKSVKKPELKVTKEDQVVMNGQEIHAAPEYVYYLFNKPAGCVSATEAFRDKTVLDYIEEKDRRKGLFPVGRLDKDTEGFLLITDDGPLAHELLSPKKHVEQDLLCKSIRESDRRRCRKACRRRGYRGKRSHTAGKAGDPFHLGVRYRICGSR